MTFEVVVKKRFIQSGFLTLGLENTANPWSILLALLTAGFWFMFLHLYSERKFQSVMQMRYFLKAPEDAQVDSPV